MNITRPRSITGIAELGMEKAERRRKGWIEWQLIRAHGASNQLETRRVNDVYRDIYNRVAGW